MGNNGIVPKSHCDCITVELGPQSLSVDAPFTWANTELPVIYNTALASTSFRPYVVPFSRNRNVGRTDDLEGRSTFVRTEYFSFLGKAVG